MSRPPYITAASITANGFVRWLIAPVAHPGADQPDPLTGDLTLAEAAHFVSQIQEAITQHDAETIR